jgi:hypothetical protein
MSNVGRFGDHCLFIIPGFWLGPGITLWGKVVADKVPGVSTSWLAPCILPGAAHCWGCVYRGGSPASDPSLS